MADELAPRRGEVWLVSFEAAVGGEVQKTRPAVILSNDIANALLNRVQAVPVSSQVDRLYPTEAAITLNGERRKAMADQITTASKWRRGSKTGYSWSRVDVAGSGDGTLTFSGAVRDGSMCWRSGEAAGERP